MEWWEFASCKDDPAPEAWFGGKEDHAGRARAVRVCMGCPVRHECLAEELKILAVTGDEPRGVRAALTAPQRARLVSA